MIIKEKIFIDYLKQNRRLHIYIPDEFEGNLPVIYMFDGHNLFYDKDATYGKCWGLKDYLDYTDCKVIVVGIECNHKGKERLNEFCPYVYEDYYYGHIDGTGRKFLQFMVKKLKPYIDTKYPTDPDKTYIGGSSMGGLMAFYGILKYPAVYKKAICISPYLFNFEKQALEEIWKVRSLKNHQIYYSWGDNEKAEDQDIPEVARINTRLIYELTKKGAQVFPNYVHNGEHSEESWEKELPLCFYDLDI